MKLPPEPTLADGPDLLVRRHRPVDLGDILHQGQDAEIQRWTDIPVPYTESDAAAFLSQAAVDWRTGAMASFAVVYQGRYAGDIALRLDGAGAADVGFRLGPWARGKGVMTRALRLALAWGFDELGLEVLHCRVAVDNWPARCLVVRCGFKVTGTVSGLIVQRGARRDGWIGSLRRGYPLNGAPFRVRAGRIKPIRVSHRTPGCGDSGRLKVLAGTRRDRGIDSQRADARRGAAEEVLGKLDDLLTEEDKQAIRQNAAGRCDERGRSR